MDRQDTATLRVRDLNIWLGDRAHRRAIIEDVSLDIRAGEVLCLVGESGSGKTLTGLAIMGMLEGGINFSGKVMFGGQNLLALDEKAMQRVRGNRLAMIFQDPMMTLNPVLRVGTQVAETIRAHRRVSWADAWREGCEALRLVGIPSPEERMRCYPHEFSGGMRQRVAIAIAFLHRPDLIIADEPTTALDVTTQSQILAQVQDLSARFGTAFLWVTHDLALAAGLADRIAVMYAGKIVETGTCFDVLSTPQHPYTRGLLNSVPTALEKGARLAQIPGAIPTPGSIPSGCRFRPRCGRSTAQCETDPVPDETRSHQFRCWHPLEVSA